MGTQRRVKVTEFKSGSFTFRVEAEIIERVDVFGRPVHSRTREIRVSSQDAPPDELHRFAGLLSCDGRCPVPIRETP